MQKIKVVDKFEKSIALLMGEVVEDFTIEQAVEFLNDRKEKHIAKSKSTSNKPTKAQIENEGVKEQIMTAMSAEPMSVADVCDAVNVSNQKATALLTQLRNAGKVQRVEIKGKPFYKLAVED